jgi:hypothetical protein
MNRKRPFPSLVTKVTRNGALRLAPDESALLVCLQGRAFPHA